MANIKKVKASELPNASNIRGFKALGIKRNPDGTIDNVLVDIELLKGNVEVSIKWDDLTEEQREKMKGPKGDPLTFDDLTPEQINKLKGADGKDFTYEDFTAEQLDALKGEPGRDGADGYTPQKGVDYFDGRDGKDGENGKDGYTPQKGTDYRDGKDGRDGVDGKNGTDGTDGKDFKYSDFTPEQLEALRGPRGEKGDKGDALDFSKLTDEEKQQLGVELTKEGVEAALGHSVNADVPAGAKFTDTVYTHPKSHSATMINETSDKRFVSDTEKQKWNNKWDYDEETIKAVKVNNATNADSAKNAEKVNNHTVNADVPDGAKFTDTVYEHPATHPATMIRETSERRFVSDAEKEKWNKGGSLDEEAVKAIKVNNAISADVLANKNSGNVNLWIGSQSDYDLLLTKNEILAITTDTAKIFWNGKQILFKGTSPDPEIPVPDPKPEPEPEPEVPDTGIWNGTFADPVVNEIMIERYDKDGDGKLSEAEVLAVTAVPYFGSRKGEIVTFNEFKHFENITEIGLADFSGWTNLKYVILPNRLERIESDCFHDCKKLKSIAIPESVVSVKDSPFTGCDSLEAIIFKSATPPETDTTKLFDFSISPKIYVPNESLDAYKSAFNWHRNAFHPMSALPSEFK